MRLLRLPAFVADGGVDPRTIVMAFEKSGQFAPRGVAIGVLAVVDQLGYEGAVRALHRRIVPAIRRLIDWVMAAACRMSRYSLAAYWPPR